MRRQPTISVIVPCYNEEENLSELVERIVAVFHKKNLPGEIILIDDGSIDHTGQMIQALGRQYENVICLRHKKNRGIPYSWKRGLGTATGRYVCLIDADLQYQPEDIFRLYREIRWRNVDVVQGWRSSIGRQKDHRYLYSIILNGILNFCFAMHARDNKSSFIICRKPVLQDILTTQYQYRYFQTLITVAAKYKGYSIREIESLFEKRLLGKTFIGKFPLQVIGWTCVDILKAIFEFRILKKHKMDDPILRKFLQKRKTQDPSPPWSGWRKRLFRFYSLLMPAHHWMIDQKAIADYQLLKRSQWLSPQEINKLQFLKLKKLLHHAYHHVDFYRERFDRLKLKPDDIQSFANFRKIPFLTKQEVRAHLLFDLFSDNHNKKEILKVVTSGSTGEPLVLYADKHQLNIRWAATLRGMEWAGYRFGDRQVRLWHQTLGMSASQIFREKLDALLSRRLFVPAYEMCEDNLTPTLQKIKKYRPRLIDGYAESFNLLAHYLKAHPIPGISPRGIISSAQTLPPQSRAAIEQNFHCRVFDKYGSREFSGIAYECAAHQGHHISAESYYVEIIKDNRPARPGEMGEVVITDLNNFCVPLIRYRIGDLATAVDNTRSCPCGRGLPRLGELQGRIQAIIVGPQYQYVPGTFFAHLFKEYWYAIRQFQIVQNKIGEIDLNIVKGRRFQEKALQKILAGIKQFLGQDLKIKVHYLAAIPLGRTGKHQHSISYLDLDFQKISQNNEGTGGLDS